MGKSEHMESSLAVVQGQRGERRLGGDDLGVQGLFEGNESVLGLMAVVDAQLPEYAKNL